MSESKSTELEEVTEEVITKTDMSSEVEKSGSEEKLEKTSKGEDLESDAEKAKLKPIKDPLKDRNRMQKLKKWISHLCLLVLVLALENVFMGLCAYFLYSDKNHFAIFGALCVLQLVGAPIGWVAIKWGNRCLFLMCVVINIIWIISVIVLLLYYWLALHSPSFDQEIALHVSAIFFGIASLLLAICCFLVIRQWNTVYMNYKKEEVYVLKDK